MGGNYNRTYQRHQHWFDAPFALPEEVSLVSPAHPFSSSSTSQSGTKKDFQDYCVQHQKNEAKRILVQIPDDILNIEVVGRLHRQGMIKSAQLVKELLEGDAETGRNMAQAVQQSLQVKGEAKMHPETTLALFADCDLTKASYEKLSEYLPERCYSYGYLLNEKKKTYPPAHAVTITDRKVEVGLQAMLDHTTQPPSC